ncbi:RidA family protein [bacterium]|nr:RidA family protein [bacterium]
MAVFASAQSTENAPAPIGPYSQAVKVGNLVFTAGQIPLNPQTGEMMNDSVESATQQVFVNLKAVLEAGGSSLQNVVKFTVFLKDLNDFQTVNAVFDKWLSSPYPARSAVQVARLPLDVSVEIEAIAEINHE